MRRYLLPAALALPILGAIFFTKGKLHPNPHLVPGSAETSSTYSGQSGITPSGQKDKSRPSDRAHRTKYKTSPEERGLFDELESIDTTDPFFATPDLAYQRLAALWVQRDPAYAVHRAYAMDGHPGLIKHVAHAIGTNHPARWSEFLDVLPETASGQRMVFLGGILDSTDTSRKDAILQKVADTVAGAEDQEMIKFVAIEILADTDADWLFPLLAGSTSNIYDAFFSTASFPDPRSGLQLIQSLPQEKWDTCLDRFPGNSGMTTRSRRELADAIQSSAFDSSQKDSIIVRSLFAGYPPEAGDHALVDRIRNQDLRESVLTAIESSGENSYDAIKSVWREYYSRDGR